MAATYVFILMKRELRFPVAFNRRGGLSSSPPITMA